MLFSGTVVRCAPNSKSTRRSPWTAREAANSRCTGRQRRIHRTSRHLGHTIRIAPPSQGEKRSARAGIEPQRRRHAVLFGEKKKSPHQLSPPFPAQGIFTPRRGTVSTCRLQTLFLHQPDVILSHQCLRHRRDPQGRNRARVHDARQEAGRRGEGGLASPFPGTGSAGSTAEGRQRRGREEPRVAFNVVVCSSTERFIGGTHGVPDL